VDTIFLVVDTILVFFFFFEYVRDLHIIFILVLLQNCRFQRGGWIFGFYWLPIFYVGKKKSVDSQITSDSVVLMLIFSSLSLFLRLMLMMLI